MPKFSQAVKDTANKAKATAKEVAANVLEAGSKAAKMAGRGGGLAKRVAGEGVGYVLGKLAEHLKQHPEWYLHYPEAAELVGLNFAIHKDSIIPTLNRSEIDNSPSLVQSLWLSPSVPVIGDQTTGWRTGLYKLWSDIRRANSGRTNFSVQQLEKYILDCRSLLTGIAYAIRAYRCLKKYEATNGMMPQALFAAMGLDYYSFSRNMASLDDWISLKALQFENLTVNNVDLFSRTLWLYSNIFKDSDIAKASYMLYGIDSSTQLKCYGSGDVENTFYVADYSINGTTSTGLEYSVFINNMDKMFAYFTADPLYPVISGDILRAFDDNKEFKISTMWKNLRDKPIEAILDESQLTQWQNARPFSAYDTGTASWAAVNLRVIDDPDGSGFKRQQASMGFRVGTAVAFRNEPLVNMYNETDCKNAGKIMSVTRLSSSWYYNNHAEAESQALGLLNCGTEIPTRSIIYVRSESNLSPLTGVNVPGILITSYEDTSDATLVARALLSAQQSMAALAQMDYHFCMTTMLYRNDEDALQENTFLNFDLANFAEVSTSSMSALHDVAAQSLLYGKFIEKDNHMRRK